MACADVATAKAKAIAGTEIANKRIGVSMVSGVVGIYTRYNSPSLPNLDRIIFDDNFGVSHRSCVVRQVTGRRWFSDVPLIRQGIKAKVGPILSRHLTPKNLRPTGAFGWGSQAGTPHTIKAITQLGQAVTIISVW